MSNKKELEEGADFTPVFNADGLIPCIAQSANSGKVLMFAWMNEEALRKTQETGEVHYWSRSRQSLWHKGATSGEIQKLVEMRADCDQDCLLLIVEVQTQPEKACHTGRTSCFYRKVERDNLSFID